MKYSFILILLLIAPLSYAESSVSEVIENINIQGISLSSNIKDAQPILKNKGYETADNIRFKKGNCKITLSKRLIGELIGFMSYDCKSKNNWKDKSGDIKKVLDTLCRTKNNGVKNRRGCNALPTRLELFESRLDLNGHKYTATIKFILGDAISISLRLHEPRRVIKPKPDNNKEAAKEKANFPTAVTGASKENIIEANEALIHCKNKMGLTRNCNCYADAFLKERISYGFQANIDVIHFRLGGVCLQADVEAAHSTCIVRNFALKADIKKMTAEQYCSCYANKFAELIDNFKGITLKNHKEDSFKSQSRGYCSDLDRGIN